MRIWSVHPAQLDRIGLVACWRETLLAQAVLAGHTKGYLNHPQLVRFRACEDPIDAVSVYLRGLHDEATARGFNFNGEKILRPHAVVAPIPVTTGQLDYEWQHLGAKLQARSPEDAVRWQVDAVRTHPLFVAQPGPIEKWERV